MIKVNIHPIERVVRGVAGVAVLSLVAWGPKSLWGLLGLLPLATALTGWCPPYSLLGIATCPRKIGAWRFRRRRSTSRGASADDSARSCLGITVWL